MTRQVAENRTRSAASILRWLSRREVEKIEFECAAREAGQKNRKQGAEVAENASWNVAWRVTGLRESLAFPITLLKLSLVLKQGWARDWQKIKNLNKFVHGVFHGTETWTAAGTSNSIHEQWWIIGIEKLKRKSAANAAGDDEDMRRCRIINKDCGAALWAARPSGDTTPPFAQHVASTWTRDIYYMSSKTGSQTGARLMWPPGGQQTWKQLQEKNLIFFTPGNRMYIRDRMDAVRTKYILGNRKTRVSGRHNSQYELERNQRSILRVLSSGWLLACGNGDAREAKSSREAARPDLRLMGDEIAELPELQKLEGYLENVLREGLRRA
ncbi:hypothetical protein C8J57DRAFT_1466355 [Mycena rebaudengoi]|nr:hypothetical protein C8J57DRAFT_1466355 [Mycena rebaudengoi]